MKMSKVRYITYLSAISILLSACTSEEPNLQNEEVISEIDSATLVDEMAKDEVSNERGTDSNAKNLESIHSETNSLKEEYLERLIKLQQEMEEERANPEHITTYALKKVEGDIFDTADGLLNKIYGVLQEKLSAEEMEKLRIEQREWIKYRDKSALEAAEEYKGGTMENLVYVVVMNELTTTRCVELVNEYME